MAKDLNILPVFHRVGKIVTWWTPGYSRDMFKPGTPSNNSIAESVNLEPRHFQARLLRCRRTVPVKIAYWAEGMSYYLKDYPGFEKWTFFEAMVDVVLTPQEFQNLIDETPPKLEKIDPTECDFR